MLKHWRTALALAAMLAGGYFASSTISSPTSDDALVLLSHDGGQGYGPMQFDLDGRSVRGLYPGKTKPMKLTVINPYGFRLRLQRLSGRVATSSQRGCSPTSSNLVVRDFDGRLPVTIAAHGRVTLAGSIPVTMPWGASQKCAGSHFMIRLSGAGSRIDR
jgi:hypothetical protein